MKTLGISKKILILFGLLFFIIVFTKTIIDYTITKSTKEPSYKE